MKSSQSSTNREMDKRTYEAVVLAADGVGAARVACTDTYDGDRGAAEADDSGDVLDDDPEEAQDRGGRLGARLSIIVVSIAHVY